MIVISTGFSLNDEAFIEDRLSRGVNVIFSDDNNKGKTLVIQGLMYCLGNEPIFPAGFNYRRAIFYAKCEFKSGTWRFLRRNKRILVLNNDRLQAFDSISEFKRFFSRNISALPSIIKDGAKRIVDPELFFQIFFLPQDKRNTSTIINSGFYKKQDFEEMLHAISNTLPPLPSDAEVAALKKELAVLRDNRTKLQRRYSFAQKHPSIASITQKSSDRSAAEEKRKEIQQANGAISSYQRERTREENRIAKLQRLIGELNSLNKELSEGKVSCADCGSKRVIYKNNEFEFDVSNSHVRTQILGSINEQIQLKQEVCEELTRSINLEQDRLQKLLDSTPKPIQEILLFTEEIATSKELESKIDVVNSDIEALVSQISAIEERAQKIGDEKSNLLGEAITLMNYYYKLVDPNGLQVFDSLFSKKDQNYSGSEGQEYYFARLLALNDTLEHDFPIIVDSFRGGELSSSKEAIMLECYAKLDKQVILTSTLKAEEYSADKYNNIKSIHPINYSDHNDSHILNAEIMEQFSRLCMDFGVNAKFEINEGEDSFE